MKTNLLATGINFYRYNDYRDLLRDWYYQAKESNKKMSFRYMSRHLGLKSPNHFQLVITRKRHLSLQTLGRVQKMIQASMRERQYLNLLFRLDQASTEEKRAEIQAQIIQMQDSAHHSDLNEDRYKLVGNSLAWFIKMAAIAFDGQSKKVVIEKIQKSCPFPLESTQIESALESLQKLELLSIEDDTCQFEFGNITTQWDFDRSEIKTHHLNNLRLAIEAIPFSIDRRFFNSVTVPCSDELYSFITHEIRTLAHKVLDQANKQITSADQCKKVVTLHFSLFPYFEF